MLFLMLSEALKKMDFVKGAIQKLRSKGFRVQVEVTSPSRISRWLEYASKSDFDYVIIIGLKEAERRTAILRNLKKWSQVEVPIDKLGDALYGT
jgi:histidyl-tRNA synthetase